jgi:hypothetical protein
MQIKYDSLGQAHYTISNDPWLADSYTISTFGPKTTPTMACHSPLSKPILIGRELAARLLRQARKHYDNFRKNKN